MPSDVEERAVAALKDYGGCSQTRAEELLSAWVKVFEAEAVGIVAGDQSVTSSVTDLRVERVKLLVEQLENAPLPNRYELGVLLRVTPSQAQTVLRNWRARHPEHYEEQMKELAEEGEETSGGSDTNPTYVVSYKALDVLEYAVDCLRRNGLQQGLKVDRSAVSLEVPEATTDAEGRDALTVLGIPR